MADYEARVGIDFDVTQATASLQRLQQQISAFQSALAQGSAASAKAASNLQRDLLNNINATGKFSASMTTVASSAENFTRALETNKLSMGQYFRYAGASTKTFGRFFKGEFDTINKVVRERVKTIQTQFVKMGRDSNGALQAIKIRPLALDLKDYGTQAQMAAQRQAVFNQLVKQGSTQLLNFGKNTQWAGRQLMVGFTIPLTIMGATAVKEFEKIEKQAIRFKRVYGDAFSTTAETDKALDNVRNLAKEFTKYGIEVEKTLELAADAAQMGLKNADLLAQVTEATRLAVLGEVEQQEALETSISLTNAFGIAAEDLANKINFLNAVENETVTAISDLTTAIPKAGPVIQQLGGNVEDLAFFLTAMKEGGINASEGANALKSGLAKIINPTEKASLMLQDLGININSIVETNAGDIKNTVLELADALDSLDPLNRARAIEELFGRFQFARISTLFQNIVREGSQAERVLKLSRASAEELAILSERELKRVEDSPLFKFQKQIEQLQASLAPLGEEFLKAITPIIEFARQFLDNFNNMSDGAKRFAVVATTVIAGIGPIALMTFGLIANGVANLIKLFSNVGRLFTGFGQKTTDLGMQTQYLTNEQLESQAAAISMGQAHANLTQVLTSETSAVSALAAAYNTMTAAQRRAAARQGIRLPNPGSGPMPKKYNSGVLSVPGPKGAGDVVPAMLSPGEAVIPAKQSAKYAGLIQGMISDNIPGYRFGLNPFAAMLGRSRVTTRMKSQTLQDMLKRKDTQYRSAFETGTGDDYLDRITGRPKINQQVMRTDMEQTIMGIPRKAPASSRPTYGSVELTPMGRLISRLFGLPGKQFRNIAKPGNQYLDIYGDTELVGKRSLNKRSSIYPGDLLRSYGGSGSMSWMYHRQQKGSPEGSLLNPMVGASKEQLEKRFWTFRHPFGKSIPGEKSPSGGQYFTSNPGYPYVEAQVAGGFNLNEVSKIRVPSRSEARQIQKLVDQAGLKIKVTPQNASSIVKMFANMFGTRFSEGTQSLKAPQLSDVKLQAAPEVIRKQTAEMTWKTYQKEVNAINKALDDWEKKTGKKLSTAQKSNLIQKNTSHLVEDVTPTKIGSKVFSVKNWRAANLTPDLGSVNQYLQIIKMKKGFLSSAQQNASQIAPGLKMTESQVKAEIAKLAKGVHPKTTRAAKVLHAIAMRDPSYMGAAAAATLGTRLKGNFYSTINMRRYDPTKDISAAKTTATRVENLRQRQLAYENQKAGSGVVKSTSGSKKPTQAKRIGGKPADNRMVAVSKGETIINQKNTNALRRGIFSFIPGLGVLGKADGMPAGQAPVEQRVDSRGRTYYYVPGKGRVSASTAQGMMAQQTAPKQNRVPRMGAGGIGMAAGMGAMAYSMSGGPGADVAGMASLPLMMLPALLPMIMNPIGAVVAGLAAAAGAFVLINNALNDTGKKAREAAENLGIGSSAMEKYAEFAGNVSATDVRDRQRAALFNPISIQAGKNEFGANFLQSETGSQLLSNIKGAGGFQASEDMLLAQLQAAVSGGSLTVTQARNVAYAIAEELGDQAIGMDINAQLTQLFGPNGENLINEPLKVQVSQIQATETRLEADFDTFLEATDVTQQEFTDLAIKTQDNFRNTLDTTGWGFVNVALDALSWLNPINWAGKVISGDVNWNVLRATGATVAAGFESAQMSVAATNAYIVKASSAIQNYQSAVDSLDVNYDKQIAAAQAAGDEALAQDLINRKAKERNQLMEKYASATKAVREQFEASEDSQQKTLMGAATDRIKEKFAEDADSLKIFEAAAEKLTEGADKYELTMLLNADAISLSTFDWISNNLSEGSISRVLNLETKLTGKDLGTMTSLLSRFGSDRTQQEFIAKFELAADAGEAQEVLSLFTEINNLADTLGGEKGKQLLDFYVDPKNAANAEILKNTILDLKEFDGDKLTIDYIQNIEGGEEFAKIIKGNQQYFDSLDKNQQVVYTQVIATIALSDPEQFMQDAIEDAAKNGQFVPSGLADYITDPIVDSMMRGYANKLAEQRTRVLDALGLSEGDVEDGSGTPTKNPLDDIFARLRAVRNAAVGATKTVAELIKLMGAGTNTSTLFRGTDQKLLFAGYGREFIDGVMAMDETSRSAFVRIENGVVKVTKAGKALNKAYSEVALGDFQVSLVQGLADVNKQIVAMNKLTAAGFSSEDAFEIASDATLAYAIATAATNEELETILANFKKLQDAETTLNFQTKEGTATEFNKLYDKAVGYLEAQKATINAQFEVDTNADQDIIRQAQDEINALAYELDDYQAEIYDIEQQEDEVNKKYDDRLEALDKIQSINEDIIRQERANLAIADAVASGDIAAAARAMRQKQVEEAEAAAARRKEAIEKAREIELGKLVSENGRTREQIDAEILKIQNEILAIEETRLEPAQERIRLLDVERQVALDALDDQIDKWSLLGAQVNEAKLKLTPEEMSAMEYQAGLIKDMLENWDNIEDKEAILKIIKKTYEEGSTAPSAPDTTETESSGGTDGSSSSGSSSTSSSSSSGGSSDDSSSESSGGGSNTVTDTSPIGRAGYYPGERVASGGYYYTWDIGKQKWVKGSSTTLAAVAESQANAPAPTAFVGSPGQQSKPPKPTGRAPYGTYWGWDIVTNSWIAKSQPKPPFSPKPGYYWEWSYAATKWYEKKKSEMAGSLVGTVSPSAGETNRFENLRPSTVGGGGGAGTGYKFMASGGMVAKRYGMGGKVGYYPMGGLIPYMNGGGLFKSINTDTVPAMLTPGEFVMRRNSVNKYGTDMMKAINNGTYGGDSMYNYSVNVNVQSDANPDQIARAVMTQIRSIESQKVRGNRF